MMTAPRSSAISRGAALLSLTFLAMVLPQAEGQVPFLGACPHKDVVPNLDVARYLGKWYEQERYFAIFQLGGNCVTANYTDEGNGVVGVTNTQYNLLTKQKSDIKGTAKLAGNGTEAKLEVRFPSVGNFPAPYWVLDTDYDNYAIVWSCSGFFLGNTQISWILTRAKNPPMEVLQKIKDSLLSRKVELKPFRRTLQVCEEN